MYIRSLLILCYFFVLTFQSHGQGCSDAGFCTMGAMRPNQAAPGSKALRLNSVEFLSYVGYTKFKDVITSQVIDMNASIGNRISGQLKLPYNAVFGPLANTHGFSDVSYSLTYQLKSTNSYSINITGGGKIPTGFADLTNDEGRPLPMYYQTTLGTYDAVFGASFLTKKWLFATGYQTAFNANGNDFLWGKWATSNQKDIANEYPLGNKVKRGSDIMFRIERNFRSTKWNAYLGILTIYRITPDRVVDKNGVRIEAAGTTGAAITGLGGVGYRFSTQTAIKWMGGHRIVNREQNPDGLSREWVTTLSIEWRF
jgi:hypothetical protein